MSGALKIAGAIVGVIAIVASGPLGAGIGLAITSTLGMSAATLTLISTGLAIGSSLLAPKAKAPSTSPAATDRLFAGINLRAFRHLVFGHTAMATEVRDQEYSDNQTVLHRFLVIASHKVQAVEQLWFDDKLAWTAAGGAQGEFAGYLNVTPVLEGSAANAINISSRMGASRRFTGLAYLYLRYKLTGNSKNTDSPFAQSIPTRVTVIGKAALVYDPRLDSSRGGSGGQRAEDQTTWAWNDDAARNPALQLLWYLLGWRIRNPVTGEWKLAVGKGIPPERIDIDSFITAANLCDEQVARAAGGTEPRYRSDGIFTEGDDPSTVLDNFKAAMNADLDDVDGKLRITVLHNDLGSPQIGLTADDVLDSFRWTQTPSLTDSFNVIRGSYTDPSTTSLYQQVDYPEVRIDSPDGIDRVQTVNLPMVQSPSQAQRLVKQRLQRMQYGGMFEAVFQATAWRYRKGDVVPFTFPALGWANKLFRVVAMTVQVDGTVPMTLREEHPDIYLWDASDAPAVQGAVPTTYNQNLLPVVLDLANIGSQAVDAAIAAGQALDRIDALSDDGVLTGDEKAKVLLKEDAELAAEWNLLDTQAAGLSSFAEVASARVTASSAWTAWITYRNALSPAWNNTTLDTFVDRTVFRGKLTDLRYALNLLAQALRNTAAVSGFNLLRNTRFERGVAGWTYGSAAGITAHTGYPITFSPYGVPTIKVEATSTAGTKELYFFQDFPVTPLQRYAAQSGIEGQGSIGAQNFYADFFDSAGAYIPGASQFIGGKTGQQAFNTKVKGFFTAPSNAVIGRLILYVSTDGTASTFLTAALMEPMISTARVGQTDFPPYSPGVADARDGLDGQDGLPGAPGANGQSSYVHFAYADSADGSANFTTGAGGARAYIGVYSDFTAADSTNPAAYTWSLIKGADGTNGTPGPPGANGQPSYVHIAYANSADGTADFHLSDPTGRAYIGVYTDSTVADSTNPAAYTWSLIKGANGADALSVSLAPSAIPVPCTAGGTPKGALQGAQFRVFKGTADVTGSTSYSVTAVSNLSGVSVSGGGAVTVAGITGGTTVLTGYADITATKDGASQSVRLVYNKALDGAAYVDGRANVGAPTTTSYATVSSIDLLMGPNGTIDIDTSGGFDASGAGTRNVQGTIDYSLNGGSTWTTATSFSGNASVVGEPGDWAGTASLSGASIGLGGKQTVSVRVQMRKTNSGEFAGFAGSLYVAWKG